MGPVLVVILLPAVEFGLRVRDIPEQMRVQALVPKSSVEALDVWPPPRKLGPVRVRGFGNHQTSNDETEETQTGGLIRGKQHLPCESSAAAPLTAPFAV